MLQLTNKIRRKLQVTSLHCDLFYRRPHNSRVREKCTAWQFLWTLLPNPKLEWVKKLDFGLGLGLKLTLGRVGLGKWG